MFDFIKWFIGSVADVGDLLDNVAFSIGNVNVSILDLMIGFVILSIVITVFWKGASA